jgi:hypothetical protein
LEMGAESNPQGPELQKNFPGKGNSVSKILVYTDHCPTTQIFTI